ncbi:substrate-binding domain-containing protein [Anaerofilum sp. BX8]|uniref:Substrate-binding domain-containing protein n=1 Tax=Anaerofilum hominis TaxID=2763016 RepID=A0A923RF93_9FIRM|nr:substrate-binding domain-containing protein [Anaerofilum hominis]MBC5582349.1 substrate-binding domain-containing protein [Anaerofilum hominis]
MMRRFFALAGALLLALSLGGCAGGGGAGSEDTGTMRISAVLPHNDYGYWTTVAEGVMEAGARLPVDTKVYLPQLNYNVSQMTELIRQQTAAQVDAIIVQGIEDETYLAALEEARGQGIRIVFVDTDVPDFPDHLYVGTDNYQAGRRMGEQLIQVTAGKARVAVLSGAPGYPNLELRLDGLRDAVQDEEGIVIVRVEYDQYDALTVMEKYHLIQQEAPDVDTLVCIEGTGAQTLGQLAGGTSSFQHILGFDDSDDGLAGVQSGLIDGLLIQQNRLMGARCVEELSRWNETGAYSEEQIHTDVRWITAQDLDEEGNYEGR